VGKFKHSLSHENGVANRYMPTLRIADRTGKIAVLPGL
jgi:hypothetical protein